MKKPGGMIARELVCMGVRVELPSGGSPSKQKHVTTHNQDKYIGQLRNIHFTIKTDINISLEQTQKCQNFDKYIR